VPFFQPGTQFIISIQRVAYYPLGWHSRGKRPRQHALGQFAFRGQLEVVGHSRFSTAHGVAEPFLWQVQRSIKKGRSVRGGIEQKDADLTIRLPVGRSTVLIGNPG
jgi:hypothetical protein